ncbi:DCC1-like thiol-disulfide oxidoreductase family protein [Bradyrhizobium sp. CCBAU 51745]|uniref:DCC1-like thiol-disulfide oxidoreductase family protein n=1 Tax=Bradyrhizobium sp. CCBAU 51745 TaxID=1325099 RepID=UPI002306C68D|nr:hypothetical protein [Bradyrhizobium sp. CCBAU 51745]
MRGDSNKAFAIEVEEGRRHRCQSAYILGFCLRNRCRKLLDVPRLYDREHATDGASRLVVGADVAIALWRMTPGEGWLAALSGNRVVLPITRFVYDRFADLLFAWNRWCGRW